MADDPKKVTLGDLLQQKQDYDLHTFGKWEGDLQELIRLAESGDASAIHVLLKIALTAAKAVEQLVVEGEAPIRFFSAIAPAWPIIYNATPHIPPVVPANLGKHSDGPLDLSKVFKVHTVSRDIMVHILLLIHYLREYSEVIQIQTHNMATGRGWPSKRSTQVKVPGGSDADTFEWVTHLQPMEHIQYEFHLHSLITNRFGELLDYLALPSQDPSFIFSFQKESTNLPREVDFSWRDLSQKILEALTGETLSNSSTLYELGRRNEGRKLNRSGKASKSTGDVEDLITRRLDGAFEAICKNISDVID